MNKFRVGEFLIESELNNITGSEQSSRVEPKVMQVLLCLVEHAGDVVTKEELIRTVWRDTFVTDDVLTRSISELRKAFKDQSKEPHYIQTIPRSGYRLIAKVEKDPASISNETKVTKADVPKTPSASNVGPLVGPVKGLMKVVFATIGSVLILVAIIVGILLFYVSRHQTTVDAKAIGSIAVLPLVSVDSDPDTDYIADGITDNIIDRLSQLPNLRVISSTAVVHYKDRQIDPRTIGPELSVEALLTGRLVRRSDNLTISLELVNAKDNTHIWGEQYERKLSDLLAVQREIPLDVSEKLRLRLSRESKERLTYVHTDNPEANNLYLKGRYAWEKWTPDGTREAIQFFEEAIKKDPGYALAYAGLADAYVIPTGLGWEGLPPQKEARSRAKEFATKALSLDPQLGEAHAALAQVILYDDWDFSGAEREIKKAIELNPSYARAHLYYSHLLDILGRFDESFVESKKYLQLDPVSEIGIVHLGSHYLAARQYEEAIQQYKRARELYPDGSPYVNFQLGNAYHQKGMFAEAVEEYLQGFARSGYSPDKITELRKVFARSGIKGFWLKLIEQLKAGPQTEQVEGQIASIYAGLGEKDQTFEWLEKAYADHSCFLLYLTGWGFEKVRSDPRYADLVRWVGFPQ